MAIYSLKWTIEPYQVYFCEHANKNSMLCVYFYEPQPAMHPGNWMPRRRKAPGARHPDTGRSQRQPPPRAHTRLEPTRLPPENTLWPMVLKKSGDLPDMPLQVTAIDVI